MTAQASSAAGRRRLFFAVWPDERTAESIAAVGRRMALAVDGRAMRPDTLHLTLAFLGSVDNMQYERLLALLAQENRDKWPGPFSLRLDRIDYWQHNGIIHATCSRPSEELQYLSNVLVLLAKSSGIPVRERRFVPHLTLVRKVRKLPVPASDADWTLDVDRFSLVESSLLASGARYRTLRGWTLPSHPLTRTA